MEKSIVVDFNKCTGCRICELVCSLRHFGESNPKLSCIRVVSMEETKEAFPLGCANCFSPVCMDACPVQAIYIDPETKVVLVDSNRCIGCKTCVIHCPFGAAGFNPDKGVSFKCDLCEGEPHCAKFCPSGAVEFLPLDEVLDKRRRNLIGQVIKAKRDATEALS